MFRHDKLVKLFAKLKQLKIVQALQQECGSILVFTAVGIPILLALIGFGFDVGNLYMHKARLQNVADAAALAGARAYVDNLDTTKGGTVTNGDIPSKPSHANDVAREYIAKNSINLPNDIYHDFNSLMIRESDESNTLYPNKAFYRIGLYENVPLYFLPIIKGIGKTQKVRAEAIAIAIPGETETIPGGGGSSNVPSKVNPSIFDNLYTFSEWMFSKNTTNNVTSEVLSSFTGTMAYTHLNDSTDTGTLKPDEFFHAESDIGDLSEIFSFTHLYANEKNTLASSGGIINDPIIDIDYDTKAYLDTFKGKLLNSHKEFRASDFNTSDIANAVSNAVNKFLLTKTNETLCKDADDYYIMNGSDKTIQYNNETYQICYTKLCPFWDTTAPFVRCAKKSGDNTYYLLNNSGNITSHYIKKENSWTWNTDAGSNDLDRNKYNSYGFTSLYEGSDFTSEQPDGKKTNIFHALINEQQVLNVNIDQAISGDIDEPVYLLIDGIPDVHIIGTAATTRRPLILIFLSENTTKIYYDYSGEFVGTIYAPISTFHNIQPTGGTFRGNIIAKTIPIQASDNMTWIGENHLEKFVYEKDENGDYKLDTQGNKILVYEKDENGNYKLDKDGNKIPKVVDSEVKAISNKINNDIASNRASITDAERAALNDKIIKAYTNEIYNNSNDAQKGKLYNLFFPDKFPALYEDLKKSDTNVNGHPEVNVSFADLPELQRLRWYGSNTNVYEELYKKLTDDEKANLYDALTNSIKNNMGNTTWYNNTFSFKGKKLLYNAWKKLYDEYKGTKYEDLLWPWNEHFNIEPGQTVTTSDNIRLINPRVEANPFTIYGIQWKML